jgi:putative component of membrane protein insertase Oxa1/YidC/SpoIIIJ protein YidD
MIMAIKKYGSIKGFILGLKRLFRCHYPNGGYDYP